MKMIEQINKFLTIVAIIIWLSLGLVGWVKFVELKAVYKSLQFGDVVVQTIGQIQKDNQTILQRIQKLEEMDGKREAEGKR